MKAEKDKNILEKQDIPSKKLLFVKDWNKIKRKQGWDNGWDNGYE